MEYALNEAELHEVYKWVDQIPLSRPKKNIARDFSDAGERMRGFECERNEREKAEWTTH